MSLIEIGYSDSYVQHKNGLCHTVTKSVQMRYNGMAACLIASSLCLSPFSRKSSL